MGHCAGTGSHGYRETARVHLHLPSLTRSESPPRKQEHPPFLQGESLRDLRATAAGTSPDTAAPWLQEFLTWKKPGNLTRRQSAELDVDLNERFYHDYLHERSGGCGVGVAGAHACSVLYCAVLPPEQMETSVRM